MEGITLRTCQEAEAICKKFISILPEEWYERLENMLLGCSDFLFIPKTVLDSWEQNLALYKASNEELRSTASMNNLGIVLEKQGRIEEAIYVYEQNVAKGYHATHSFERLMVLYRKRKAYALELSVIERAISVFSNENCKRLTSAMNNPKNKKYLPILQLAFEQNTGVKNDEGWYIFNPYPVGEWIQRKEKVLKLLLKSKES